MTIRVQIETTLWR